MTEPSYTDGNLRTLIAFSAAQSLSVTTNNPLDLLTPLFEPIASALHGKHFSPSELADELCSRYDLNVSEELCTYWGKQLVAKGLLKPIGGSDASGGFEWTQSKLPNTPSGSFQTALADIVSSFRQFLNKEPDLFFSQKSDAELVEVLRHGAITSLFPRIYSGNGGIADDEYLFGRFIQSVSTNQPVIFDSIVKLRQAAIYCDLIAHLQSPRPKPKNSQYVALYLDSPLAMDLLGMSGARRKEFTERLLSKMKELGFLPTINIGMIEELRVNVKAFLLKPPNKRYGPAADAMRRGEVTPQTLSVMLDRAEILILDAGVQVDKNFERHVETSNLKDDLENELFSKLQSNYRRMPAVERDIRVIRGVFGRRVNHLPQDIYSSGAFFLTSNEMLSTVTGKFFQDRMGYKSSTFPVVLTRAKAAAIVDAIFGIPSSESLSMSELLVSAAEATEYSPDVLRAIEAQLTRLSPEEAEGLVPLLERNDFSQLVMDVTRGSASNVTATSINTIVQNVKTQIEIEAEKAAAEKMRSSQARLERGIVHRDEAISSQIAAFEGYLQGEERRFNAASKAILRAFRKANTKVEFFGMALWGATFVLALVAGAVAYAGTYFSDYLAEHQRIRLFLAVLAGALAGGSLVGFPLRTRLIDKFRARAEHDLSELIQSYGYKTSLDSFKSEDEILSEVRRQFELGQTNARLRMKLDSRVPLEAQKLI